jgi:hypothetical protein
LSRDGEQVAVRAEGRVGRHAGPVEETAADLPAAPGIPEVRALEARRRQEAVVRRERNALELGPRRQHVQQPAGSCVEDANVGANVGELFRIERRDKAAVRRECAFHRSPLLKHGSGTAGICAPDRRAARGGREQDAAVSAEQRGGHRAGQVQRLEALSGCGAPQHCLSARGAEHQRSVGREGRRRNGACDCQGPL